MKVGIIINRELSREELTVLQQTLSENPEYAIYANQEFPDQLIEYQPERFELEPEEKSKINFNVMDQVLNFGENIIEGKPVTDHLLFEKASLWHYHKFRIYFSVRNFLYEQAFIEKVSVKYDKILYYGNKRIFTDNKELKNKIVFEIKRRKKTKRSFATIIKYAVFFGLRIITGLFYYRNIKGKKHLLIDHAQKQACLGLKSLKLKKDNYNLGYLFDTSGKEFAILDEVEVVKPTSSYTELFKKWHFFKNRKGRYFFNEPILLRGLISKNIIRERKNDSSKLRGLYKLFQNHITNPVDQLITENLMMLHGTSLYYLFKYRAYQRFFRKQHLQTVASIDENSPRIKTILDAAKSCGIKTIGLQHGTIHELHPAYMFTAEDKKRRIQPDNMLVWGEHWKNFLVNEGNYEKDTIGITGQIRTDIIPKLIKQPDLVRSLVQYPAGKKTILFASQPQRDTVLRRRAAFDIFTTVKKIDNTHLIIKLHPAEKNDFGYYHQIAKEAGCSEYTIIYQAELYALIASTDVVVTCFSTVGAETTYFYKPLVILDHLKQDIQHYHKEGIAFQASNREELANIIKELLSGKKKPHQSAYNNYIRKFAYKIDGKVSQRVIDFIRSI